MACIPHNEKPETVRVACIYPVKRWMSPVFENVTRRLRFRTSVGQAWAFPLYSPKKLVLACVRSRLSAVDARADTTATWRHGISVSSLFSTICTPDANFHHETERTASVWGPNNS
ncbi:unnamed protein product [Ectocarpus sp. 12 AP-2014]